MGGAQAARADNNARVSNPPPAAHGMLPRCTTRRDLARLCGEMPHKIIPGYVSGGLPSVVVRHEAKRHSRSIGAMCRRHFVFMGGRRGNVFALYVWVMNTACARRHSVASKRNVNVIVVFSSSTFVIRGNVLTCSAFVLPSKIYYKYTGI